MRPYCQPIRFPQVRFYGASWFASAAACQVARSLCGSDRNSPSHRDFYFQASAESVTLLGAGYNYDSHWIALSMGLSPIGLTSSLAARPRNFMKAVECQEWRIDTAKSCVFSSAVSIAKCLSKLGTRPNSVIFLLQKENTC